MTNVSHEVQEAIKVVFLSNPSSGIGASRLSPFDRELAQQQKIIGRASCFMAY